MCDAVSLRSRSLSPFTINMSCAHTWSNLSFFSGHKFPSPCSARRAPPPTHTSLAPLWLSHRVPSLFKELFQICVSHTTREQKQKKKKKKRVESGKPRSSTTTTVRDNSGSGRGHFYLHVVVVYPVCVYKFSCVDEAHGHAQRKGVGGVRHTTPTRSRDRCREFSACAANESVVTHAYPLPTRQ